MQFVPADPDRRPRSAFQRFSTSGWFTPSLILLLCLSLALATHERGRGEVTRFKTAVGTPPAPAPTGPGGQLPLVIRRTTTEHGAEPEFMTATLLPGRGFNLWQITAFLPGAGEVPLLVSPPADSATDILTGGGADANGSAATTAGAAFTAPWAGQISGNPAPGNMLQTIWQDKRLLAPAQNPGETLSTEGLLLPRAADDVSTGTLPDGQSAQAVFHAGNFAGNWPSNTDFTINVELTGHAIELTVTAHNIGSIAEPLGVGWHPYLAIPSGDRPNALLTIPSVTRLETADHRLPTGRTLSTTGTPFDFVRAGGTRLGNLSLDETYVDLHTPVMADGPIAEIRDPARNLGIRVIPLSPLVSNFHVVAPAGQNWISLQPDTNVTDPFGPEWQRESVVPHINVLQPGDTLQWKVRLEIFSLAHAGTTP